MDAACIKRALRDHEQTRLTAYCPELSSEYGLPHAAVWRSVEQMRFDTEQYKPVPRLDALSHWEYPADHYVMIDDKPDILVDSKAIMGKRLTTVFVKQGHYAKQVPDNFTPDISVLHIGDLRNFTGEQFLKA